jgi:hypothetical protein
MIVITQLVQIVDLRSNARLSHPLLQKSKSVRFRVI